MRIGFVVNDVATEQPEYTTTRLALAATRHGPRGVADGRRRLLATDPTARVAAHARTAHGKKLPLLDGLPRRRAGRRRGASAISVDDLDVLMMRNDPADDAVDRRGPSRPASLFGQLSRRAGALVVNDPNSLANARQQDLLPALPRGRCGRAR